MKKLLKTTIVLFIIVLLLNAKISVYASESYSEINGLYAYKTGDIPIVIFSVLAVISLFGIVMLVIKNKKHNKHKNNKKSKKSNKSNKSKHVPKRLK